MLKSICVGRVCFDINLIVDKMPQPGTTNEFFEKKTCGGGAASNIGYALARWGINTAVAGVVGNDVNGTRVKKEFERVNFEQFQGKSSRNKGKIFTTKRKIKTLKLA